MTGTGAAGGAGGPEQLGLELEVPAVTGGGRARRGTAGRPAVARPGDPCPPPAVGAVEIARALERPAPTPDQVAVIEAPVAPLLVVAGAGSGKTETMAARVVWLVANGLADAEEVLGLTFTRKAAGELADRVRSRLRALHRRGLCSREPQPVTVSTYHAYAAAVLRDHGLRVGVEPAARLLTEAGAWQLAAEVVQRWDGDMSGVDYAPASVTEAVVALAGECAEHLVSPGQVEQVLQEVLSRIEGLPAQLGDLAPGVPPRPVRDRADRLAARRRLVPLVEAYVRLKREREVLDFGDQVALAARIARELPEVGAGERARARIVLLDEYQDTSYAQLVLLRGLFGAGHPVAAVGDPHQSIYGWRGASAGNLQRFPVDFPAPDGSPATTRYLPTSWRNDHCVLAAANRVSADLRRPAEWADPGATVQVPPLGPRPGAGPGTVGLAWLATLEDEAQAVADVAEAEWRSVAAGAAAQRPTVAVLCRARSQFPLLEGALRARGLPVEVVGLGGLLSVPEVADLRAALEVLDDPTRGDALMRLLTGAGLQLGPRDLEALGVWAAQLHAPGRRGPRPGVAEVEGDVVDERSIVEALDQLPPPQWEGPAGQALSAEGRRRLARLSGLLRELRARVGLPLPDLVLEVERVLLLDIEVACRPGVRPGAARAHLDAFVDVAAGFAGAGERPTLAAFLAWLSAADSRERGLEAPVAEVRPDAVQVLTVHAAKGLEWDVVAVTGLVEGTFPNRRGGGRGGGRGGEGPAAQPGPDLALGWLSELGALPYPLRGDAAGLPRWDVQGARSQRELAEELQAFRARCGAHEVAEERRLGYVALTRARRRLLLTGAVWGDGISPRRPSRFLAEVAELAGEVTGVEVGAWAPPPPVGAGNPRDALTPRASWPADPLGARRAAVEEGAGLVFAALAGDPAGEALPAARDDGWAREVDLLLAERDAAARRVLQVELPGHLSASRVVALAADPGALALHLRRPMPQPPSPSARRGSAFHAWLEQRFGAAALVDVDELPGSADDAAPDESLAQLQARFLAGEWAQRTPVAVEVAVESPVAGVVLRGRIDAVFASTGPEGTRWDVVDWKTGPPPGSAEQAHARAVQLAIYRLAWARLQGVGVERVGAAFFYAATGQTVRPVDLLDEQGLQALLGAVPASG